MFWEILYSTITIKVFLKAFFRPTEMLNIKIFRIELENTKNNVQKHTI